MKELVRSLDPNLNQRSKNSFAALTLLACTKVGADHNKIFKLLEIKPGGWRPKLLKLFFDRMKSNDMIQDGLLKIEWHPDNKIGKDHKTIAFWCDTLILLGLLKRTEVKK